MTHSKDKWASWLAERRFGGNKELQQRTYHGLNLLRDKVLENSSVQPRDRVVDIGTGDGLLGFGVLEQCPDVQEVVFVDISVDALDICRAASSSLAVDNKTSFVQASADNLPLETASADVVVARAVYSYVENKAQAFHEVYRILKPNGRFSFSEPVNRFKSIHKGAYDFFGIDLTTIRDIADKFFVAYGYPFNPDENTMTDFDERDLFALLRTVGFAQVKIQYEANFSSKAPFPAWEAFYNSAPNPNAPTLKEALAQTLTDDEQQQAIDYMKSFMENNLGTMFGAVVFCTAMKA